MHSMFCRPGPSLADFNCLVVQRRPCRHKHTPVDLVSSKDAFRTELNGKMMFSSKTSCFNALPLFAISLKDAAAFLSFLFCSSFPHFHLLSSCLDYYSSRTEYITWSFPLLQLTYQTSKCHTNRHLLIATLPQCQANFPLLLHLESRMMTLLDPALNLHRRQTRRARKFVCRVK